MRLAVPVRTRGRRTQGRPNHGRLQVERLEERDLLSFQVLETLGTPVSLPTGSAFRINDFEPNGLNNKGDVLFGNDLGTANDPSTSFGEGVFLRSQGQERVLGSSTAPAPGGGTFDFGFLGPSSLNDQGDVAFDFLLQPAGSPFGVNAGAYRYSQSTQTVTPVVIPGVTQVPGGGVFAGVGFDPSINNRGNIVFPGIVPTDQGIHITGEDYIGLGEGLYQADSAGKLSPVVVPGDAAPGGGTFDFAANPSVNDGGDVAFWGHVAGQEAQDPTFPPQADLISALGSVYVKDGATGQIISIAHAGDPAPGGGTFRQALFPEINNRGDVLFTGDLTPAPNADTILGVFLYSHGIIIPIARPGDTMPGGGHLVTASVVGGNTHLNNQEDIVFNGVLDTDVNHDGTLDTGLFEWSHGKLSLLARTGTVLPGVGTVQSLTMNVSVTPPPPQLGRLPNSGAVINDRGQVLFGATLEDGRGVLLLDTPGGQGNSKGLTDLAIAASPLSAAGPAAGATPVQHVVPSQAPGAAALDQTYAGLVEAGRAATHAPAVGTPPAPHSAQGAAIVDQVFAAPWEMPFGTS